MSGVSPRVFISYSHDGPEHEERVLSLADRLREDGIDAEIDQYVQAPAEGWAAWCERQIKVAKFVLMVCTETYHRRVSGDEERGKGLGVVWEAQIIRQLVYEAGAVSEKFIPLLFSDGLAQHIPLPVKHWTQYVADSDKGYDALYRRLTQQPWTTRPPLGPGRHLPPRPARRRFSGGSSGVASVQMPSSRCGNWAKLLNREPQKIAIVQRLEAVRQRIGRFEPLLVVIPGCASDCHEHFVERVGWHDLRPYLSDSEQPPRYEPLVWRSQATDVFMLLLDLRERLGLIAKRDMRALEDHFRQVARSMCFSFTITAHDWRANGALVRSWIDYFCRSWPVPADDHLVVAFLCIGMPEKRGVLSSWFSQLTQRSPSSLASYLNALKEQSVNEQRLLVTDPLEPIRRKHVMEWVGKVRYLLHDPDEVDELREMCRGLFPHPDATRSFEDVYRDIVDILVAITGRDHAQGVVAR
jgi:SEFIR domain